MRHSPLSKLRRFFRREDGSVSIEFILTFPLLSLLLMGSFVWFDAFRSNSLSAKSAYTLSDIASRWAADDAIPYVREFELVDLFDAHKRITPPRITDAWLRISSICWNGTDNRVLWSYVGDDTYQPWDWTDPFAVDPNNRIDPIIDATIPNAIIPPMSVNDSVLLVEVYGAWAPMADWVGFGPTTWTNRLAIRPRFRDIIPYNPTADTTAADYPFPNFPHAQEILCPPTPPT